MLAHWILIIFAHIPQHAPTSQQELGLETAEVELAGYHPEYERFYTDDSTPERPLDQTLTTSGSSSLSDDGEDKTVSAG